MNTNPPPPSSSCVVCPVREAIEGGMEVRMRSRFQYDLKEEGGMAESFEALWLQTYPDPEKKWSV